MSQQIKEALENAYRIFEGYRVDPDFDFAAEVSASGGEHRRMKDALVKSPLRELPPSLAFAYVEYIDAAHFEGGYRINEFRYFLPRVLELIALQSPGSCWAMECLARNLIRANFRETWPNAEVEAIDGVVTVMDLDFPALRPMFEPP